MNRKLFKRIELYLFYPIIFFSVLSVGFHFYFYTETIEFIKDFFFNLILLLFTSYYILSEITLKKLLYKKNIFKSNVEHAQKDIKMSIKHAQDEFNENEMFINYVNSSGKTMQMVLAFLTAMTAIITAFSYFHK